MKHAAYVTVFYGSDQFMTTIPTSRDVGYKYITAFDGSRSMHELVDLDLFAECLLKIARDARISEPELFKPHFVKPTE